MNTLAWYAGEASTLGQRDGMTQDPWPNLATMFFEQAARHAEQPFLWSKHDGSYRPQTWRQVADEVKAVSRGLRALGVGPGDRVMMVAENRPNWVVADLAIIAAGAVNVPAYTTNTEALHEHILADSGARLAIVSTAALAKHLLPAAIKVGLTHIVAMEPIAAPQQGLEAVSWQALKELGAAMTDDVETVAAAIGRRQHACFIYTSGTGGLPKGVMLSHHALLSNIRSIRLAFEPILSGTETFLSFLPLSHSYEHTCGFYFPILIAAEIYYAEGVDTLVTNMPEARPTIITCVPRLYEVMRQRILLGVQRQSQTKRKLFERTLALGLKKIRTGRLSLLERLVDLVLDKLVRDKVRKRFGGRLKAMVSGGAPLNPDVGEFFSALGVTLLQGYGQTESAPVVSCNPPGHARMATVGRPLPEVEVKIAEDGEILVKGGLVMDGYWNNPDASAEAIRDGWLHTGDIGRFDDDGYLMITDRKKDIIVNSGGDNIAPQRVEGILTLAPEIAQAMVTGDKRPHLIALLVPDEAFAHAYARKHGTAADLSALAHDKGFIAALKAAVDRANGQLSPVEKVKRFMIADEPFTVANGQMTPTLKVRRHVVKQVYGDRLDALYG